MYKIIFENGGKSIIVKGNYPVDIITSALKEGKSLIVISTYSNTVKIPFLDKDIYGEEFLDAKEFSISSRCYKNGNPFLDMFLSI